jgi:hypothetical protein
MPAKKRPSLAAVLGGSQPTATEPPAPSKAVGRRRQGHVQLNVLIPPSLKKACRMKALSEGRDLSAVVADLLHGWLAE